MLFHFVWVDFFLTSYVNIFYLFFTFFWKHWYWCPQAPESAYSVWFLLLFLRRSSLVIDKGVSNEHTVYILIIYLLLYLRWRYFQMVCLSILQYVSEILFLTCYAAPTWSKKINESHVYVITIMWTFNNDNNSCQCYGMWNCWARWNINLVLQRQY